MEYSNSNITVLKNAQFKFKKKYGQNFIFDHNIIESIIKKGEITQNDTVVEIGTGIGTLTSLLADYSKKVISYEIDDSLKPIIEENLKEKTNVSLIFANFLKADLKHLKPPLVLVANLPYSITSPILFKIIDEEIPFSKLVIMVQKEVGERIKAEPNRKAYNALSVLFNQKYQITKIMDVSRQAFYPVPNVDSIVLRLDKKPANKINEPVFRKLIKDSFRQKRKTIKNNLKEYNLEKIEKVLQKHNFSLQSRAEAIPVAVFVEMCKEIGD